MSKRFDGVPREVLIQAILAVEAEVTVADDCIAKLQKERDRFEKRECNATIELCYNDGESPFQREDLKVVDIGVSDNVYVVSSELVEKLQSRVAELEKALENHSQFEDGTYITEGSEVFIAVGDQIHRKEYSLKDQFGESPWSMSDEKYKTMEEVEASM